ncbi:hypothetical protein ASPCAL11573 [Aspergillus calidoustus]|uniref:Uncharacterized protein n=1 Tax=Aspergillus calidoustus TaxID=454130 RepID=A0A0U5GAT6_ASPCI|nr:hypothetical protein ASPCAL11573 [Aspergillus calidoustus]
MPAQSEPAFQPSSTSASHLLSSSSSSSGLYPADRATPLVVSSSCDAVPTETLSYEGSSRFHPRDMDTEGNEHPGAGPDAANLFEQPHRQAAHHAPRQTAPSLGGDPAPDHALSAFMSVPRYPNAIHDQASIPVSEVVNAVIESGEYSHQHRTYGQSAPISEASPQADLYMSDSEMTDVLSDFGGVPLNDYSLERVDGAGIFNPFARHAHVVSTNIAPSEATEEDSTSDLVMEYDPRISRHEPISFTTTQEDDDDAQKFYLDHGGNGYDVESHDESIEENPSHLSEVDFEEFYHGHAFGSQDSGLDDPFDQEDHGSYFTDADEVEVEPATEQHFAESAHTTTQERNLNIDQFVHQWIYQSSTAAIPMLSLAPPVSPQNNLGSSPWWVPPARITRPSRYTGDFYDVQQIPWWEKLRVRRSDARNLRDQWYTSYHNLQYNRQRPSVRLSDEEFYFQGKSMYTDHKATIEHFQLRNLMSVPAYNTVHFSSMSKVYSWVPGYDDLQCLIDLSVPSAQSGFHHAVKISTMKSAFGVTIAGGFKGEYAMRAHGAEGSGAEGIVTKDDSGITNHVDIISSRTNRSPTGVFASNDNHVRILDCETNTFLADYELAHAINCTSTSPDGRLRVIIGDSPDAWVVEADTGRPVHPLRGHRDFGFACAWSPDMMQIATSNQDKTAMIWDARMWRLLDKFESDVAGYRSLRYSPVGGGPRTLLLCEPADRIVIVNAQTYQTRQVLDFFGEVGGADYSPDGSTIWVANTDEDFGGFMEYDRRQWGQALGMQPSPNEWVKETELKEDERCTLNDRERHMRFMWTACDEEHEELLLF